MGLGKRLQQRRIELNMTRSQLAHKLHVTPSAIANYENGISSPKPDILISLFGALEVDANYLFQDYISANRVVQIYGSVLSQDERVAIRQYRDLSESGKRLVQIVIAEEYARAMSQTLVSLPCYLPRTRQLHSGFLLQERPRTIRVKQKDLPKEADFCFQIQTDRYKPIFNKYDVLALQKKKAGHNQIGIFRVNDICYIRALYREAGRCRLRSLNVIESDIIVPDGTALECLGTVLDRVTGTLEFNLPDVPTELD